MANWIRLEVRMESREGQELREKLGIEGEGETMFNMVVVDGDKIVSYSPFYRSDGERDDTMSEVVLDYGGWMVANLPFDQLDSLIRKTFVLDTTKIEKHG